MEDNLIGEFREVIKLEKKKGFPERDILIVYTTGGRFEGQMCETAAGPDEDYFQLAVRVTYDDIHQAAPLNQPVKVTSVQLVKIRYSSLVGYIGTTNEDIGRYVE